jgi:hypothetical protein
MNHTPRSPALAVAVLFGLFAMILLMDPAHFPQDARGAQEMRADR